MNNKINECTSLKPRAVVFKSWYLPRNRMLIETINPPVIFFSVRVGKLEQLSRVSQQHFRVISIGIFEHNGSGCESGRHRRGHFRSRPRLCEVVRWAPDKFHFIGSEPISVVDPGRSYLRINAESYFNNL